MTPVRLRHRRRWIPAVGYAFALPAALAIGCASLSNLTGGEGGDGGRDAHAVHDAQADPLTRAVDSAGADGPLDAGTTADAAIDRHASDAYVADATRGMDARADGDATLVGDARAADAALVVVDAPCLQTQVEASPNVACAPVDAGVCAPRTPDAGAFTWHPPHQVLGACTLGLVQDLLGACFSSYSTDSSCDAYLMTPGARDCTLCMYGDWTASTYGPIVAVESLAYLNVGGCLALADPCNTTCAVAAEEEIVCPIAACESRCPLDAGSADASNAEYNAFNACAEAAHSCACEGPSSVYLACSNALNDQPSTAACFGAGSFNASVEAIASLFCINGTWDAGTTN